MSIVIALAAVVAAARGVWTVMRLVRAVPRSNADFHLPEVA